MEESTIRLSSGHVRIVDREYKARERLLSLQYPVDGLNGEGLSSLTSELEGIPGVDSVVPRLRFGGMISHGDDLRSVMVVAANPPSSRNCSEQTATSAKGDLSAPGEREAVLGRRLLNRLQLGVGDRFTLVFSTSLGALRGYTFTVVGAFESGLPFLDDGTLFVPLDVAQRAVDFGDAATEVLVMASRLKDVPQVRQQVDLLLADGGGLYTSIPWYEHNEIIEYLQVGRRLYDAIYIGLLVLASFVVVNTFVMIVNERRREIGMMMALGLRPGEIRNLFLIEGGLCGLLGSLGGAVVGAAVVWLLSRVGIPLPGADGWAPN